MTTPKPLIADYATEQEWETAVDEWLAAKISDLDYEYNLAMEQEDRYDSHGNVSENGIYDAGGHLIENWYDRVDEDYGRDR